MRYFLFKISHFWLLKIWPRFGKKINVCTAIQPCEYLFNNRHLHPPICISVFVFALQQLKEMHTLRYIFMENSGLCYEVTEKVVQHIVHCVETQGRHVEYLKALKTLVKAEGQSIRKTQDMVMAEVTSHFSASSNRLDPCAFLFKRMQLVGLPCACLNIA